MASGIYRESSVRELILTATKVSYRPGLHGLIFKAISENGFLSIRLTDLTSQCPWVNHQP